MLHPVPSPPTHSTRTSELQLFAEKTLCFASLVGFLG